MNSYVDCEKCQMCSFNQAFADVCYFYAFYGGMDKILGMDRKRWRWARYTLVLRSALLHSCTVCILGVVSDPEYVC